MSGTAIGGVIWPSAAQTLLSSFGLRQAYVISGAGVLLIAVPLMFFLLKDPRGIVRPTETTGDAAADGMTRGEALRGSLLWLLIFSFFIISISIHSCMIHLVPLLTDRGVTAANAAFAASVMGLAGMIGRLGMGYLLDLLPVERVPTIAFSLIAAGIFLLFTGVTGVGVYLAAMLIGFGYGAESATIPYIVSRYFGLRSFGEIYSYLFITVPLGGALGPALMGEGFDRLGSYRLVLLFCFIATAIAALLMLRLASYRTYSARSIELILRNTGEPQPLHRRDRRQVSEPRIK
jgi:MFS family permease